MAERDQLGRSLRRHDSRELRGHERIALRQVAETLRRRGGELDEATRDSPATDARLVSDVDHADLARLGHVREIGHPERKPSFAPVRRYLPAPSAATRSKH